MLVFTPNEDILLVMFFYYKILEIQKELLLSCNSPNLHQDRRINQHYVWNTNSLMNSIEKCPFNCLRVTLSVAENSSRRSPLLQILLCSRIVRLTGITSGK